jgi:hypothetical protein
MTTINSLPCIKLSKDFVLAGVFSLPFTEFKKDWYGKVPQARTSFLFGTDEENLFFALKCEKPAAFDKQHKPGEYTENLWQYDVAELFIVEPGSGRYQEFNLSPAGSWWSMLFSDYRVRDLAHFSMPKGLQCSGSVSEHRWQAALMVPLQSLSLPRMALKEYRFNVCSIINGAEKQYLSWAESKSEKPDFHRTEHYVPLERA